MDPAGAHVIQIHPYGSTAKLPYTTMGSGSLAAMSVLEDGWKPGMNEEQVYIHAFSLDFNLNF